MSISSIAYQQSTIFSFDKILQDISETSTEVLDDIEETCQSYKEELNLELKTTDRVWLEFHAGQCEQYGKAAQSILYRIVKASINCPENSIAAANAITILKVMKVSFSCLDLRGVQIPRADLSNAILNGADLAGANLENADLANASLNGTNMSKVNLKNAKFGVPNIFIHEDIVFSSIVSPDNKYLVSRDTGYIYFWDIVTKTCIKKVVSFNEYGFGYAGKRDKIFTFDGQFLIVYDKKQNIYIWSVGNFQLIKKLKISNHEDRYIFLSFLPNGAHFITYGPSESFSMTKETNLKIWEIQKAKNNLLDVHLKNEVIIPYEMYKVCFSKKIPFFYFFKTKSEEPNSKIYLSIWSIEMLSKVINIPNKNGRYSLFADVFISLRKEKGADPSSFSLTIMSTSKHNEELLFVAIEDSIYSVNILKNDYKDWTLGLLQATKITTEIDTIYDMHSLVKTNELIYICNEVVCLYSIKNNQLIGKFRLIDSYIGELSVSLDETNIFIGDSVNKVFMYSVEALKSNKYTSYQMSSNTSQFSSDTRSVISISNNCCMQMYDIENGNILELNFLENMKPYVLGESVYEILLSPNIQYILISRIHLFSHRSLLIIDAKNDKIYLKITEYHGEFGVSNNFEYLALTDSKDTLTIYKIIPYKQCIGKFGCKATDITQITISENFLNTPKIASIENANKIIVCNFVFKNDTLKLISLKKLPIDKNEILRLQFTENDTKLIGVCKRRIIIWDIEHDQHKEYNIQAECVGISLDGTLLIYYDNNSLYASDHRLCLWSIAQKKPLIIQTLFLPIRKLQISPDNRYIIGRTENGAMYIWKIMEGAFRLLWRTSHNLQTRGLVLSDNNLEKDVEDDLIKK